MSAIQDAARQLPSDHNFAILTFADALYKEHTRNGVLPDDDAVFAIRFIEKFVKRFGLKIGLSTPTSGSMSARAMGLAEQIRSQRSSLAANIVDVSVDDILEQYSNQKESFGLAKLTEDEKKKIQTHLENVRKIIGASSISDRKKNALFERLSELQKEVNLHGTRTDRFFAFAGDVGFVLGDVVENAKPLVKEVKEVLRIISRSRARQEGISLPPGDEILRLAGPDDQPKVEAD